MLSGTKLCIRHIEMVAPQSEAAEGRQRVSRRMSSSLQNADGILLLLYSSTTEEGKHNHMHSQEEHWFCQTLKFLRNSIKSKGNLLLSQIANVNTNVYFVRSAL